MHIINDASGTNGVEHGYTSTTAEEGVDDQRRVYYWKYVPEDGTVQFRAYGYPSEHPVARGGVRAIPDDVRELTEEWVDDNLRGGD